MSKDWVQTFTGRQFFPFSPTPESIDIRDIAHALSQLCRYNGHCVRHYSVAEHSVHVSRIVGARINDLTLARWALLHDASEAYLADVPRPVKHLPAMAPYREAEARLQAVICIRFGLEIAEPVIVAQVDHSILGAEARQLLVPVHPEWNPPVPPPELAKIRLGVSAREAEAMFLNRFEALFHG